MQRCLNALKPYESQGERLYLAFNILSIVYYSIYIIVFEQCFIIPFLKENENII